MKIDKHIEIVRSSIPSLSSMSERSADALYKLLTKYYVRVEVSTVNNLHDLSNVVAKNPDLVFLGMKFVYLNDNFSRRNPAKLWLSEYFSRHAINYTGSGQSANELEFDKQSAKQQAMSAGLNTSPYFVASVGDYKNGDELPLDFPLFIKPTNIGGGVGVDDGSIVHNFDQFRTKVASISRNFDSDALAEEYLTGREFSVAILEVQNSDKPLIMPIEVIVEANEQGDRIRGGKVKADDLESIIGIEDSVLKDEVCRLAVDVFRALGARDFGRIDIRLDDKDIPQFLEANLIPSLIDNWGSFPKACSINRGFDYKTMILHIVELGLARADDHDTQTDVEPAGRILLAA
jgi:D-alanine-D-alanine ligase